MAIAITRVHPVHLIQSLKEISVFKITDCFVIQVKQSVQCVCVSVCANNNVQTK